MKKLTAAERDAYEIRRMVGRINTLACRIQDARPDLPRFEFDVERALHPLSMLLLPVVPAGMPRRKARKAA